jgi:hypothetical protein
MLRSCLEELERSDTPDPYTKKRLEEMLSFLETVGALYEQVRDMPKEQLEKLIKMGSKLNKFLGILG